MSQCAYMNNAKYEQNIKQSQDIIETIMRVSTVTTYSRRCRDLMTILRKGVVT